MKIAVISDIHDRAEKLEAALLAISSCQINTIICCGDIASSKTAGQIAQTGMTVFLTLGNAEKEPSEIIALQNEYKNLTVFKDLGEIKLEKRRIGFTHFPQRAENMAQSGAYDFVFYGHTHTPWIKNVGKTLLLNPGEIASHFGRQSTFAIVDLETKTAELKILY